MGYVNQGQLNLMIRQDEANTEGNVSGELMWQSVSGRSNETEQRLG